MWRFGKIFECSECGRESHDDIDVGMNWEGDFSKNGELYCPRCAKKLEEKYGRSIETIISSGTRL